MVPALTLIGFGEAGLTFAKAGGWAASTRAYDRLTDDAATRPVKEADYLEAGVTGTSSIAEAVLGAELVLSLVTPDEALNVARDCAGPIGPGTLFLDLNSVSPPTKARAAASIEKGGGTYVDVAILAPVEPGRLAVPLLVSGPNAAEATERLCDLGFSNVKVIGNRVGQASAVKMIRSVMVKGLEALTAECLLAAEAAGVREAVLASLDSSDESGSWFARADYNLDRMIVHGLRRAEEMEEVVNTLEHLGVEPAMSRGTVRRQREIGSLRLNAPAGIEAKLRQLMNRKADAA